jgi:hypothetical protein
MPPRLEWDEGRVVHLHDGEELEAWIDTLSAEARRGTPFLAELVHEDGSSLSIGLGHSLSVLNYVRGSGDPPYLQSRGMPTPSRAPLAFLYRGDVSEFPPESLVPTDAARAALRLFFERGVLSDDIEWEEV